MRHALGYVNAVRFCCAQFKQGMFAIRRGSDSQIHYGIEYFTLHAVHHLDVVHRRQLKVHASYHVLVGDRVIFFRKVGYQPLLGEHSLMEDFHKLTARILKRFGLQFKAPGQFAGFEFKHLEVHPEERLYLLNHETQHLFT